MTSVERKRGVGAVLPHSTLDTRHATFDRHLLALLVLVAAYTALFGTLWVLRQRALFSYEWEDDAARNQMIYNTIRGRPFWSTVKGVHLGGHASITWAMLAPFSLIYPGIETACLVLTLGLGLTAVPVYLVARDALRSRGEALILGAAALLYAPLHAVNLHTLNAVTPTVPLLAWAYWAFHRRRLKTFLAFAVVAMLCKEDIALAVMAFGVYALVKRRRWPWIALPVAAALVWLAIAFKVVLPGTYPKELGPASWLIGARQSMAEDGSSGGVSGAVWWMLRHPEETFRLAFNPTQPILFAQLFAPVLLVCFVSPGPLLVALPAFGLVLLHMPPLLLYHRHWIAPTLPFILMAAVLGCARAKRFFGRVGVRGRASGVGRRVEKTGSPTPDAVPLTAPYVAVLGAVLFGCALSNVTPNIIGFPWPDPGWPALPAEMYEAQTVYAPVFYRPTERSRNAWPLIRQIPAEAPVAASGDLLVPLSARAALYEFLDPNLPLDQVDYLLINTRMAHVGAGHYWIAVTMSESVSLPPGQAPEVHHRRVMQAIEQLLASGEWTLVERRGDIHLLRRKRGSRS